MYVNVKHLKTVFRVHIGYKTIIDLKHLYKDSGDVEIIK